MKEDIRDTALYREAEAYYKALRQPGTGRISDAADIHASPSGEQVVFAGTIMDALEGSPTTRICQLDLASAQLRVLTHGSNTDRLPKYSPDGRQVAFLSDRHKQGDFQLYLLNLASAEVRKLPSVDGWVEYLHWSPDGKRILLGVAGYGADVAGGQGAIPTEQLAQQLPAWAPSIDSGDESYRWRHACVYELATDSVRRVSHAGSNIWEAVWCGDDALAVVVSQGPDEAHWYSARLHVVNVGNGTSREMYVPRYQLGWPSASATGQRLAIVEGICSDRWIVAGELQLIDASSGNIQHIDTRGLDVTHTEWRSEERLLLVGHRGFETVVAYYDVTSGRLTESWKSAELTTGGFYARAAGLNDAGDCVLIGESFERAPEVAVIRRGDYRVVTSFGANASELQPAIESVERIRWRAQDGMDIQGWLLRPRGRGPYPLILNVHGGPVWHWRPRWLGRAGIYTLMLVTRGYAVFLPNPRGSVGHGQDFIQHVVGDMGGADTQDHLSGLDHLIEQGIADPKRLGVMGGSYGGFMTSWLICRDTRFAAAVAIAPVINWVTEHLLSNLSHWVHWFLGESYQKADSKYFHRSPIMHAHHVRTPTLNICGAKDRCTPPQEAAQFHSALRESGGKSVLVTYPDEGHGIRKLPAAIDCTARIVRWFEEHMPAGNNDAAR